LHIAPKKPKGHKSHKSPEPETPEVERVQSPNAKPVFYVVIMGKLAYRHQVSLWLSSLRKLGGYQDEVVVVTDKPVCLAKTLTEAQLLGPKLSSDEHVDIFGPAEGYTGNLHMIKRPPAHSINMMKLEKARGWLNVGVAAVPHEVSSIIYTDEDVVIGKDISGFVSMVRSLEHSKHTLALFRDTGKSAGELHTGIVVMFPGAHTDQCMQDWARQLTGVRIGSAQFSDETQEGEMKDIKSAELDADVSDQIKENAEADIQEGHLLAEEIATMGPDQQALGRTKSCKRGQGHDGIRILPENFFWLPTPSGLKRTEQHEFVHFTNTGRWKIISHGTIKKYLLKIGIPEHIDPMGSVKDKACQ